MQCTYYILLQVFYCFYINPTLTTNIIKSHQKVIFFMKLVLNIIEIVKSKMVSDYKVEYVTKC